jgi:hypothetical protein
MIRPEEKQEVYQAALVWVRQQIEGAERQGLTLDYLGGWHLFQPDRHALEHAWRVLYDIPDTMTYLLTPPQGPWEQVLLRWLRHQLERGMSVAVVLGHEKRVEHILTRLAGELRGERHT